MQCRSHSGTVERPSALFPRLPLAGTLVMHDMPQTVRARCNAPNNSAFARQCDKHSNNKLIRHVVGILISHRQPLLYKTCEAIQINLGV